MKTLRIFLLMFLLMLLPECGIKKAMEKLGPAAESIAESIEKVSNAATALLNKINDIARLVDSKLESGELTQGIADLIDGRLQTVSEMLESTIQNSGGYIFDRIDGSVDNAFDELGKLLDDLAASVLGNYVPSLINQISEQIQLQLNTVASSMEDLIVVTAGQTVYVIDKTFNGLVITIAIILLAIGLIILAIILLKKGRKLTGANFIGIGLIAVFLVVFLIIIFSPATRGKLISGFDYGAALKVKEITPRITGVVPQDIVLGKTKRIYIYGTHLNKLKNVAVKLTQGDSEKFTFPQGTLIVNTSNRIILGNLDKELQWFVPIYSVFKRQLTETGMFNQMTEAQVMEVNRSLNTALYPEIKPGISVSAVTATQPERRLKRETALNMDAVVKMYPRQMQKVGFAGIAKQRADIGSGVLGTAGYMQYLNNIGRFFLNNYKIAEGDYGLKVFADTLVESPQFVTVLNPPPPIPDPDIFVMDINWTGGVIPVAGQSASLDITFGFSHPEQIQRSFNAKIITVPYTTSISVNVPEGKIAAASSGNKIVVTTNPFSVSSKGTYSFNCSVDDANDIRETNEGNNTFSKYLNVGEYVYDVNLTNFSIEMLGSFPFSQDGSLTFSLVATGGDHPSSNCAGIVNIKQGTTTPLNCSFSYPGMREGQTVMLTFIPSVKIDVFFIKFSFSLGNVTWQKYLDVNPTGTKDMEEYDILREGASYKLHGKMSITRRRSV